MRIIFDFLILGVLYFILLLRWLKKGNVLYNSILYLYICAVLSVTLMPFYIPWKPGMEPIWEAIHYVPFDDIIHGYKGCISGTILNVIMMIPFGFLLAMKKNTNCFKVTFIAFLFSFFIETTQLLYNFADVPLNRMCDVTDLITNTLGGYVGYISYKFLINYTK